MKKLILAVLLLAAVPAFAAVWSVNTNATQDTRLTRKLTAANRATCTGLGLAAGCTQAQARTAFCAKPGSSGAAPCTVFGQPSSDIVVFTTVGDFLDRYVIDSYFRDLKAAQQAEDKAAWDTWLASATPAQKDSICLAAGLSAGCLP